MKKIASLLFFGCSNYPILDSNNTITHDVRCENNVTVVYEHKTQEKLYLIKDEGNHKVLREYKTGKIILKEKKK